MSRDVGEQGSGPPESANPSKKRETLANAVADGLFRVDASDRFVAVNDAFLDVAGCSRADLLGEPLERAFSSAAAEQLSAARRGLDGSTPETVTLTLPAGDDQPLEVRLRATGDGAAGSVRRTDRGRAEGNMAGEHADALGHTEARLHEETRKFRSLVDAVEEYAIFMLDPDGRIASWNEGAARIKGYDADEVLGEHFSLFYTDEDADAGVPEENLAAVEAGTVEDEGWRVCADGSRFWANVTITAIHDEDGDLRGYAKVTRDMTERREREEALRRERDLVSQILEANPVGIAVLDAEGEVVRLNEAGADVLGIDAEEAGDLDPDDWTIYDEDGNRVPPREWPQSRALRTGAPVFDWRCKIQAKDGTRRWISTNAVPLFDDDGAIERIILTANDVSTLKERQAALRRERDLVEKVIEVSPDMIGVFDADDGILVRANARAEEFLGAEEVAPGEYEYVGGEVPLYDEDGENVPPDERPFALAIRTGEPVSDWQGQMVNVDGERRWFSINATPIDEDGDVERVVVVGDDITRLKEQARQLERQRDELEDELSEVFERVDDAFYAVDDEFRFTYVNEWAEQLLQHDEETLLGRSVWEVFPEATETSAWPSFHDALETQEQTSYEAYFDPLDFWVKANVYPSETGLSVYFEDVTERKERERELEEFETIVETVGDGIYVVNEDGRFTMVNEEYAAMAGYDREELVGKYVTEVVDEDVARRARELEAEMLAGDRETASLESELEGEDGETIVAEATFALLPSGDDYDRIGVVRDVTERKERERALEESERRYRTLVENFPNGTVALFDEDLQYTAVGGQLPDQLGFEPEDVIGDRITERYPDDLVEEVEPNFHAALDGEATTFEAELYGLNLFAHTLPVRNADGEVFAGMLVVQNVTKLREHERELQTRVSQQEAVTDLGQLALEERDLDALFDEVTDSVAEMLDADYCKVLELLPGGEEVLLRSGVGWQDGLVGEATVDTGLNSQAGYTLRTEEPVIVDDLATESRFSGPDLLVDHDVTSGISVVIGTPDDPWGVLGVHTTDERDFSEHDVNFVQSVGTILATAIQRTERERDLERYETMVETIWDGVYALDPDGNFELVNEAFASMLGYEPGELLGEPASIVHSKEANTTAQQMASEVLEGDRESATMELELRTIDGESVPAETRFGPYPYDEERYGRAGVSRDVTERLERQRALERQREELAALNRLNEVVGEITHAAVESSSREDIERLVCERLADSESYLFAWVGEVDRANRTVVLRTEAGVEGYLDDVTLTIDPEEGQNGPTARAVRTREPQITQDTETDAGYEPWREHAREYGFRSSAAIPTTYEDALYGVLNVYSERVGAFDAYERTLLARLGNVVGHTINALERKEALMSDQVIEIDVEIPDVVAHVDGPVPDDGTIIFDRTVAVSGDTFLEYGTVNEAGLEILEGLVESVPFWEEVAILDDRFGEIAFELRLSEPPAISTVASYGGRVQASTIEDGDYRMTVELPSTANIRAVIEALQAEYPNLHLAAQRRTTRETWSAGRIDAVLKEQLTDRQRATIEAAYYAGYFDTPRKRNGEEVAESLGITAPTLHQHLRKAQRKLLAAMLNDPE